MKIINFSKIIFLFFVLQFHYSFANQTLFDDFDGFGALNAEYLSEFKITEDTDEKWQKVFANKNFEQINTFLNNLPVLNADQVIQELIFEILTSKKIFDRNLVNSDEDKVLFKSFINKLFETGRLSEIELIYSQTTQLENNSFILKKMIEGNLLRNRHSEACKILNKVNQDPLFFGKIMIICNIINSKFDEAKLGLQLLKEQNKPGDIFFIDLAYSLMSEKDISQSKDLKKNLNQIKELNPIIMSSLQFADISPNFEQIENLTTSGLLFILSNPSVDTDLKIYCSEILVKQGRISLDMLSEAYQLLRFEQKEIQNAEKIYKSLSPIRARPLLYQSIIRDNKPESKFRKIIALIKISINDNLLPQTAHLIGDLMDFNDYVKNNEDTVLISKMYQSKKKFTEARQILEKHYKAPTSDYRNLAIDIAEFIKTKNIDYLSFHEKLEKLDDTKTIDSVFFKKLVMVLISNLELDQKILNKLFDITVDTNIKPMDAKDFFLANKLSTEKDYFNSFILLFKIIGNKDLLQLNYFQSYSVLTILKNLGFEDEFQKLSERIIL